MLLNKTDGSLFPFGEVVGFFYFHMQNEGHVNISHTKAFFFFFL